MSTQRPGIDPSWLKVWKQGVRTSRESMEGLRPRNSRELQHFIVEGVTAQTLGYPVDDPEPKLKGWQRFVNSKLAFYGSSVQFDFEHRAVEQGVWDSGLASAAFAARFTSFMIDVSIHEGFPVRFPGRILQMLGADDAAFTALGLLAGADEQALTMARMQIRCFQKGYFSIRRYYPIYYFMLRLFAKYLGEPPLELEGEARDQPILNALLAVWSAPQPEDIAELCLAACDFHTHRCKGGYNEFVEFSNAMWVRVPIEILLLFKLRDMSGLQNPVLDHPLMAPPFDALPPEVGFHPDDLLTRVRARMQQDGYDEAAIVRQCLGA